MDYAGDISPHEAWSVLERDRAAMLVDVRTVPEWQFVGLPDLGGVGKHVLTVSWQVYPGMSVNGSFVDSLREADATGPILFLCRSGVRSRAAAVAATAAGLGPAYNVAGGFEGDPDGEHRRGRISGWKAAGLPWVQE